MRKGKITPNGVVLETHESATVVFLTEQGFDIDLIKPSRRQHSKSPDFKMNGLLWEMKSPTGNSRMTLEHAFRAGLRQSENLVFDLRRMKTPVGRNIEKMKKLFGASKRAKRLLIVATVDKSEKLIDIDDVI